VLLHALVQVLQVAEQVLKCSEGLLDSGLRDLPMEAPLGLFFRDLTRQLESDPSPGEVLRCAPDLHTRSLEATHDEPGMPRCLSCGREGRMLWPRS
jgi:hypothetical protein